MKLIRKFAAASLLSAGFLVVPAALTPSLLAQEQTTPAQNQAAPTQEQNNGVQQPYKGQDHDNIQTKTTQGKEPTQTQFTKEQLLTSTVHQAWLISGKNEANFFEMVEQLADISAHNRGVTLPDSAAAGRRMGDYIKRMAHADTDQLLYAIVDKAVLNATTDAATSKAHATPETTEAAH